MKLPYLPLPLPAGELLALLLLHGAAVAGLWRAMFFPLRRAPNYYAWPRRFPLAAVDREQAGPLWPLRFLAERFLPYWLQKPLATCPACMATAYGPLPYFMLVDQDWRAALLYLLYWPALSAVSAAFGRYINPEA